jgi:hypothetical protein
MKTIVQSLGEYENSNNEKIEIIQIDGENFQIKYENGKTEAINTLGHIDGWWHTTTGSIQFGENFLLLSHGGDMIGDNAILYNLC